ncbi:D-arabinono-1,4-lactone oxidase [uncultured Fibrella sp.]|uniref:D-arabinono-1,4-lactone oxidase n=1 Tax=uncultured Fibrella sp. TaxID=1284596 RepID=UPI0035CA1936
MQSQLINGTLFYLPHSIDDVKDLLRQARQDNQTVSVRGSGHSFPLTQQTATVTQTLHIMLSYLNAVSLDSATGLVTVQAGCHLGLDPFDPTGVSTTENSLCSQLDPLDANGRRQSPPGWALPDLGGITHQTIGGFMATGSSGGSTQFAFEDALRRVKVVYHGETGVEERTFERPADNNPDDPFFGAAFASMGLMGIVVEATYQCIPAFNISGSEQTFQQDDCALVDLFGAGDATKPGLQGFLQATDYTRLMWWPQAAEQQMVIWQAARTDAFTNWQTFVPKPYLEVPYILGSQELTEYLAGRLFEIVDRLPNWLEFLFAKWFGPTSPTYQELVEKLESIQDGVLHMILKFFVSDSENQPFQDIWWNGLPMDNQMSDELFPVWFTELWIPIGQTQAAMNFLRTFYEDPENAGIFSVELYAAKSSQFWLSPAYQTDVFRIDIFWFAKNEEDPIAYYDRFWKALPAAGFDFRPHWGKYLPDPSGPQGTTYLRSQYPNWDKFMTLRQQMDPHNLFVTPYWKRNLGL